MSVDRRTTFPSPFPRIRSLPYQVDRVVFHLSTELGSLVSSRCDSRLAHLAEETRTVDRAAVIHANSCGQSPSLGLSSRKRVSAPGSGQEQRPTQNARLASHATLPRDFLRRSLLIIFAWRTRPIHPHATLTSYPRRNALPATLVDTLFSQEYEKPRRRWLADCFGWPVVRDFIITAVSLVVDRKSSAENSAR